MPIQKSDDGSILDETGMVLYFSLDRFKREICLGDSCFVCGMSPANAGFNDEHVLPVWILRRFDLFNRRLILPNGTQIEYRRQTVPCCVACNEMLGRELEQPVQRLLTNGFDAFVRQFPEAVDLIFKVAVFDRL